MCAEVKPGAHLMEVNDVRKRYRHEVLLLITCLLYVLDAVVSSIKVYYSAVILQEAQNGNLTKMVLSLVIAAGSVMALLVIEYLNNKARLAYISKIEIQTKKSILHSILHRAVPKFRAKDDAYYFNLLTSDIDTYRGDYLMKKLLIVSWVSNGVSSAFMLCKLNPWLFLTGIVLALIPVLTNDLFTSVSRKAKNRHSEASEQYAGVLQETISGYEVIRTSNSEASAEKRFDLFSVAKRKAASRYAFVQNMSMQAFYTFAALNVLLGVGVGGYLVICGKLNAVMMIAAQSYFATLSNAFSNIIAYVVEIRATKDIREKIKNESNTADETESTGLAPGDITYQNVCFSFDQRKLIDGFSYTFQQGKAYAIIGESGCGKSTLTKLLLKYYGDYSGKILIGDQDIRSIPEDVLYQNICVVDQSAYLFNASLYENITMFSGCPAADSPEYRQLLASLNLEKLAEQVGDQKLGDFGEKISGGERQRINIARAVRMKKPIMILDEPTTGLDPENTSIIHGFIFSKTDTMRIVITHDRSEAFLSKFDGVISL